MRTRTWMIGMMLASATLAGAATNDLTSALQKGLFEEEANRNLDAAIAAYQSLVGAFDKDRQVAATAVFRLGECYRKLGKTNEAVVQYERIVNEFPDQQTLATLSRQNLAGLGSRGLKNIDTDGTTLLANPDADLWNRLRVLPRDKLEQVLPTLAPDSMLTSLLEQRNAKMQAFATTQRDFTPEHPSYKEAQAKIGMLEKQIAERVDGIMAALQIRASATPSITPAPPVSSKARDEQRRLLEQEIKLMEDDLAEQQKKREAGVLSADELLVTQRGLLGLKRQLVVLSDEFRPISAAEGGTPAPVTNEEEQEIRRIQAMIQNSPDLINSRNSSGYTPLQRAAQTGQVSVVNFLLANKADMDTPSRGRTALQLAAENGHKAVVELLLQHGADINAGDQAALQLAIWAGYSAVIDVLLAAKPDVNHADAKGYTALYAALSSGNRSVVERIIALGADVRARNKKQETPLHFANRPELIELLLANKADVNARDERGCTPLYSMAGNAPAIEALLKNGADLNARAKSGETALHQAVENHSVEGLKQLLAHKPNLELGNQYGFTPLQRAYLSKYDDLFRLLLDAGANPNVADEIPRRVTIWARSVPGQSNNRELKPNGDTLLHWAVRDGESEIVDLLLAHGADANARNQDVGWTPLHLAAYYLGNDKAAELLLAAKADVNARTANGGSTPLHLALSSGNIAVVELLLKNKADPNARDGAGLTPLDLVKQGRIPQGISTVIPFAPGAGRSAMPNTTTRSMRVPGTAPGTPTAQTQPTPRISVIDLLRQYGADENVQRRSLISVSRRERNVDRPIFVMKGTNTFNRYTLLEFIAESFAYSSARQQLAFPDFTHVRIERLDRKGDKSIEAVDAERILSTADCAKDIPLEWGDVVEIPELDHRTTDTWAGLSGDQFKALRTCLQRHVEIEVKGERRQLLLMPYFEEDPNLNFPPLPNRDPSPAGTGPIPPEESWKTIRSFRLHEVLSSSGLLRISSDLSRVKVMRRATGTAGKKQEWVLDCSDLNNAPDDLWLRDGDVIEVPEKS